MAEFTRMKGSFRTITYVQKDDAVEALYNKLRLVALDGGVSELGGCFG